MKKFIVVVLFAVACTTGRQTPTPPIVAEPAPAPAPPPPPAAEATSLLGKPLPPITMSAEVLAQREKELATAKANYEKEPTADNIIWLGRRTAYLGRYREAIDIFTQGIAKWPQDARLYRHRGHRYISIRDFDKAIADFKVAESLTRGKPDGFRFIETVRRHRRTPIASSLSRTGST
jgi:tetratricopeptide (TPR) repeat protein